MVAAIAAFGCGKKSDSGAAAKGDKAAASTSGRAWTPDGYEKMSASCKKALACCEDVAKGEGAKSAEDYNGKCSGPAMWKDPECDMDLKSRAATFESASKPVPDACK
jgi:hypothetical protein